MSWYPGCGECCQAPELASCILFQDDFDDGVIDPNWIQDSGQWFEAGGYIETASNNAKLIQNNAESSSRTRVRVYGELAGDIARIYLRGADQAESFWAEIEFSEPGQLGILRLADSQGYQEIYCYSSLVPKQTWINIETCVQFDSDTGSTFGTLAVLDGGGNQIAYLRKAIVDVPSGKVALGTGPAQTGLTLFDDYQNSRKWSAGQWAHCPTCPIRQFCYFDSITPGRAYFNEGFTPTQYVVEIAGVTDFDCPEAQCSQLNGAYVLPAQDTCTPALEVERVDPICSGQNYDLYKWRVELWFDPLPDADGLRISVQLSEYDDGLDDWYDIALWTYTWDDGTPASAINNFNVPLSSGSQEVCDGSAATCVVTASF